MRVIFGGTGVEKISIFGGSAGNFELFLGGY